MGAYNQTVAGANSSDKKLVEERLAEVSGASGVKARLGAWNETAGQSSIDEKKLVEERTAEVSLPLCFVPSFLFYSCFFCSRILL